MSKLRAGVCLVLLTLVMVWTNLIPANADQSAPITRYHADVRLTKDGVARVTVEMTMNFSAKRGRGPILTFAERQHDGQNSKEDFVFEYSGFKVSSPSGANTTVKEEYSNGVRSLRIGRKDVVYTTPQQYRISYEVTGLIAPNHPKSGLDEFNWNAIGKGWTSRFSEVSVRVSGPANLSKAMCFYGPVPRIRCETSQSGTSASYSAGPLLPGYQMQVVAGFPVGTFPGVTQKKARRMTAETMFELTPVTGAATGVGALAALGGLVLVRRRHTRDDVFLGLTPGLTPAAGQAAAIGKSEGKFPLTVQFHPPKGATPGEIGTLIDATANHIDVSATIIDLAVRGYLRIESTDGGNFVLHALHGDMSQLRGYEEQLLANLFQGASVRSSQELRAEQFAKVLPTARSGLYGAVMGKGWFKTNPRTAQLLPIACGVAIIIAGVLLALMLGTVGWGLLGIPVVLFGIGLIVISGKFRRRTALGSAYLAQAKGFELYLRTAEKETLRFEEGQDIFSTYLPYAMVFGVADRWSRLFAELGAEGIYQADTSWYTGMDLMHGFGFAYAMSSFTHSMSSTMLSAQAASMTSSSGSSSGLSGFSGGGGFSGTGGGSW